MAMYDIVQGLQECGFGIHMREFGRPDKFFAVDLNFFFETRPQKSAPNNLCLNWPEYIGNRFLIFIYNHFGPRLNALMAAAFKFFKYSVRFSEHSLTSSSNKARSRTHTILQSADVEIPSKEGADASGSALVYIHAR